ncbi:MAG: hypothetical protein HDR32_11785 [Treponema sp.]|nr:hypothetical protein [Treponema sp.]
MKKILKTATAALVGMLAFGLAACTDGDGDFVPENPKFYKLLNDETTNDPNVTAVWNFEASNLCDASSAEGGIVGVFDPSNGKGATLDFTNIVAKYTVGKGLQLKANSSKLSGLSVGDLHFTLTLTGQSNIQITAAGSGSKDPKRLVAIARKDDPSTILAGKDNFESNYNEVVTIEGADAGEYIVYVNGVIVHKIDADATSLVTRATPVEGLKFAESKYNENTFIMEMNVCEIKDVLALQTLSNGKYTDTSLATWTILGDETVAKIVQDANGTPKILPTASGEAILCARVGRFTANVKISVKGDAKLEVDAPEETQLEVSTGYMHLTAKGNDSKSAVITDYVEWSSSDPTVATVDKGMVFPLKEGTATITAKYTLGRGEPQVKTQEITVTKCDKTIITLLDTKDEEAKKKFPAQGTTGAMVELSEMFKDCLTVGNDDVDCTIDNFVLATDWHVKLITSNVDDTQYPGILFTQTSNKQTPENPSGKLVTFDVVITPKGSKELKLTNVTASFRANKYTIKGVEIKKDTESVASASNAADKTSADKDWRDTRISLEKPLIISSKTTLTVALTYEQFTLGDQFSVGDIKLFFAK